MTLDESLAHAEALHEEVWRAFAGSMTSHGLKTSLLLGYASLALEHHEAIASCSQRPLRVSPRTDATRVRNHVAGRMDSRMRDA